MRVAKTPLSDAPTFWIITPKVFIVRHWFYHSHRMIRDIVRHWLYHVISCDSCPHCIVWNRIHACTLNSSGHTSTQLPWRPCQIFTSASHHIASRVEQICGTRCVAWRSTLTVGSRHERAWHTFLVLTCKAQLCNPVQSGSKPPLEVDWN